MHEPCITTCPASVPTTVEERPAATVSGQTPWRQLARAAAAASDRPRRDGDAAVAAEMKRGGGSAIIAVLTKPAMVMATATSTLVAA